MSTFPASVIALIADPERLDLSTAQATLEGLRDAARKVFPLPNRRFGTACRSLTLDALATEGPGALCGASVIALFIAEPTLPQRENARRDFVAEICALAQRRSGAALERIPLLPLLFGDAPADDARHFWKSAAPNILSPVHIAPTDVYAEHGGVFHLTDGVESVLISRLTAASRASRTSRIAPHNCTCHRAALPA